MEEDFRGEFILIPISHALEMGISMSLVRMIL